MMTGREEKDIWFIMKEKMKYSDVEKSDGICSMMVRAT